jgi:hypothetical protein
MNRPTCKKPNRIILTFFLLIAFVFGALPQTSTTRNSIADLNHSVISEEGEGKKKEKKRKDEFKVYAGINFNQLNLSAQKYETTMGIGWLLGASYKRGRFFYWELGARFANPVYNLDDATIPSDSASLLDGIFGIRNIDIPVSFGINILSPISRIVGLRVFVSAVPAFAIGVGANDLNISMDDINTFNFLAQGGVGVDVAFLFIEVGMNYGFQDLFKNYSTSNPYQIYLNLGFRF